MEMNTERRQQLLAQGLRRTRKQVWLLPLHRQVLNWVSRAPVKPVLMPNNQVRPQWVKIDP